MTLILSIEYVNIPMIIEVKKNSKMSRPKYDVNIQYMTGANKKPVDEYHSHLCTHIRLHDSIEMQEQQGKNKKEKQGNYSCLKVDLIFTRDRAFYFTTVFIPGIILVTSSFITFWLEWNAVPARVMIGVTTMLNFFTTSNGFRSTLPVVSNLTAMNVWDGVCMCFIYVSLLEFVCVNYVGRKRPLHNVVYRPGENPVTQGEKKREGGNTNGGGNGPNEIIACTNCGPNPCTHTATNGCAAEVRL
ncbi:hypothetical protein PV328_011436 [Microctonus aethiopoides]|uniref:Neurotransmitter-gated ion-channel transmembrane domain-containing protein n=1 Tax=Microctonus aethiopoides TaxID=144406 RepID=A0AA39C4F4_9HYME|nr:hypothetical protein PV328_011436 [Microctonus aethiopoides]